MSRSAVHGTPAAAFGANVRRERLRRGWSQMQLSAASGISLGTIGGLEAGHHGVTLNTAAALAQALEGSLDEMAGLLRAEESGQENREAS